MSLVGYATANNGGGPYPCGECAFLRRQMGKVADERDAALEELKEIRQAIVAYVNNPGCNLPAKKRAMQRLLAAAMKD